MYGEEERGLGIWFKDGIENILLAIDDRILFLMTCPVMKRFIPWLAGWPKGPRGRVRDE